MLKRTRFFLNDIKQIKRTVPSSSSSSSSVKASADEAPYLLEADVERKAFIDPEMLRGFTTAFLVGTFSVGAIYWLMSHKVTHAAMHRRRLIQSMAHEDLNSQRNAKSNNNNNNGFLDPAYYSDPFSSQFSQFVAPSCSQYKELIELHKDAEKREQQFMLNDFQKQQENKNKNSELVVVRRPSTILSDVYHSSLLHETAVDSVKGIWNNGVEEVQNTLRTAMGSWVDMRERETVAAVNEMARSVLGANAVAVKVDENKK